MSLAIEANGLIRRFGTGALQVMALRGVDLALERGQLTLLMGPSGCGKSTLLAVLAGLLRPDAGNVRALDTDLWALQESQREAFRRRHSGFVFQGFNLFPSLSATQQLEIVLRWSGPATRREARRLATRLLGEMGLADRLHLYPQALSGGEKQRVAIARALVKQPALLFADEPTSALDWAHGEHVVHLLRQAARQQNSMVLAVSHDPRIVPFADRVLHLSDGQLDVQPPRCAS